jgi:hypothetical protein
LYLTAPTAALPDEARQAPLNRTIRIDRDRIALSTTVPLLLDIAGKTDWAIDLHRLTALILGGDFNNFDQDCHAPSKLH